MPTLSSDMTSSTSNSRQQTPDPLRSPENIHGSRCCSSKYETFVYIVGIFGIAASIAKIVLVSMRMYYIHEEYPETQTYYICGIGIAVSGIVFVWEVALMYFVKERKLRGLQNWMFAHLMIFLGSCVGAAVAGAVYKLPGLTLALSFVVDMIRSPIQMILVHKFIMFEKLAEDYITLDYKKF